MTTDETLRHLAGEFERAAAVCDAMRNAPPNAVDRVREATSYRDYHGERLAAAIAGTDDPRELGTVAPAMIGGKLYGVDYSRRRPTARPIPFRDVPDAPAGRLTDAERSVLGPLADAWNAFLLLPVEHSDDVREMRDAIHRAQTLIAWRVARRVDPADWS